MFFFGTPKKPHASASTTTPSRWGYRLQAEVYEPRLVLSAQPLVELAHHTLLDHSPWDDGVDETYGPIQSIAPVSLPTFSPQAIPNATPDGWIGLGESLGLTGKGQTVAVIDSGIAFEHQALGGGLGAGYRVLGGWDFAENDANPHDDGPAGYHGTHVAGIIGADGQHSGVASQVDFVALRVFDDRGNSQLEWTEQALRWIHQNRFSFANPITTVNLSLGSEFNGNSVPNWGTFEDELRQLHEDGIVVVGAAGNSFQQYKVPGLSYPSASPYVIPVAAVDSQGQLADYSQRHDRALAAPGDSIMSSVPDHFLGRDGIFDDWSQSSGTSMAAPYVAGASVLVRQAMEMADWANIGMDSIYQVLRETSDTIWDSVTQSHYQRIDVQAAIASVLPQDRVGDDWNSATSISSSGQMSDGWMNRLGDQDTFRYTATTNGRIEFQLESDDLENVSWSILKNGSQLQTLEGNRLSWEVQAGQSYAFGIKDSQSLGSYDLEWNFLAQTQTTTTPSPATPPTTPTSVASSWNNANAIALGEVDQWTQAIDTNRLYRIEAANEGWLSILVASETQTSGPMMARIGQQAWQQTSAWDSGQLRLDLQVQAGQMVDLMLPSAANLAGELQVVNLVSFQNQNVLVHDSTSAMEVELELGSDIHLSVAGVRYAFQDAAVDSIHLQGSSSGDSLDIRGSTAAEIISLRPDEMTLNSASLSLRATQFETISVIGGGGADRASLYDSDGNDTLTAKPKEAELVGAGYRYNVSQVERIYVNAQREGEDLAFLFDSEGNDVLAIRPQFSSLRGDGYFNSIDGFERVMVYANAGGDDTAQLYDSVGDDIFSTSGDAASVVGSNYFAYTRFFEHVEANASAGGNDRVSLYASAHSSMAKGVDFASFETGEQTRMARGFEQVDAYRDNRLISLEVGTQSNGNASQVSQQVQLNAIDSLSLESLPEMRDVPAMTESTIDLGATSVAIGPVEVAPVEVGPIHVGPIEVGPVAVGPFAMGPGGSEWLGLADADPSRRPHPFPIGDIPLEMAYLADAEMEKQFVAKAFAEWGRR